MGRFPLHLVFKGLDQFRLAEVLAGSEATDADARLDRAS
jgi:hypothetical protein